MNVFHYHPATNEFIGTGAADPDPLEGDRYLIPAFATEIEPPTAGANEVAVFENDAWILKIDRRGETWWNAENKPVQIDFIGDPDGVGLSNVEPLPDPPSTDPADYTLNRVQFETLLIALGLDLATLETAIKALNLESILEANAIARLRNSQQFHYDNELVQNVRVQINMTETQLSDAWMQAKDF